MTAKRFMVDDTGTLIDMQTRDTFDYVSEVCSLLNELHEENQSIKKHIGELYELVKIDVDNEIEVYPKVLLEYIVNILKIIGDLE